jgi:hypothetical protein
VPNFNDVRHRDSFQTWQTLQAALCLFAPAGHDGRLISDRRSIAKRYVSGWFWFDLLSSLPFEQVLYLHNSLPSLVMLLKVRCMSFVTQPQGTSSAVLQCRAAMSGAAFVAEAAAAVCSGPKLLNLTAHM